MRRSCSPPSDVNHRARREEEQRLEEGVGHQMEDCRRICRHAAAQKHIAELRDSGVSQHALDVVLHQSNGRGEDGRERADRGHHAEREGRVVKQNMRPGDHVNAGRDHGGRVNQRGDRRGAFHRVGQPDVERQLRALARRAQHQAKRDDGKHAALPCGSCVELRADLAEGERAEVGHQQKHSDEKAEVADAVDDEGLLARVGGGFLLEPEADQQVRGQAHALPANKHHQRIAGQHQHRHEKQKKVEVGEVPRVAFVVAHVADGVDVNQEADAGDDQQHDQRKLIEDEAEVDVQQAGVDPGQRAGLDVGQGNWRPGEKSLNVCPDATRIKHYAKRSQRRQQRNRSHKPLRQPAAQDSIDEESGEGQERNQPEMESLRS